MPQSPELGSVCLTVKNVKLYIKKGFGTIIGTEGDRERTFYFREDEVGGQAYHMTADLEDGETIEIEYCPTRDRDIVKKITRVSQ